jgi:hypothetical protein
LPKSGNPTYAIGNVATSPHRRQDSVLTGRQAGVPYFLFFVFAIPSFIGGNWVTATSAPSFTLIGLSITREIGLSVETFKFTVSGQPDNVKAIETKIIRFHLKNM